MYAVSNSIIDTPVHSRPSSAFNLISICAIALIARYVRNPCLRVKGPDKQIQGFDAKKILFQVAVYLKIVYLKIVNFLSMSNVLRDITSL
jgi:hypothetical protein